MSVPLGRLSWASARAARTAGPLIAGALAAGCAASECLKIPLSSKVSAADLELCRRALDKDVARGDVFVRYVELLRARGRHADIERAARRTLAETSGRTEASFYLAFALRKQGKHAGALAAYRDYAAANRDDPDPHYGMALCHERLGDREAALAAYQRYVDSERRAARSSWRQRARARIAALRAGAPLGDGPAQLGDPAARIASTATAAATTAASVSHDCSVHERAIAADPFATDAYDRFAACAGAAGRHADVIRRMRIALRDNPDFGRGWLHLGRAQQALGQDSAARAALARACAAGVSEACQ